MEDSMDAEDFLALCAEWGGSDVPEKPDMDLTSLYNSVILNETKEESDEIKT
jgi:hypothetical protein